MAWFTVSQAISNHGIDIHNKWVIIFQGGEF